MIDALRPYISRILSALIATAIGAIATKLGIDATSVDSATLAGSLGTFLTLVIYSVAHKLIDKKVNPADAASSHLAIQGKARVAELKATSNQRSSY